MRKGVKETNHEKQINRITTYQTEKVLKTYLSTLLASWIKVDAEHFSLINIVHRWRLQKDATNRMTGRNLLYQVDTI